MRDSTKKFAVGAVIAAAAGFVTGILTAPKSGKETRQDIKDTTVRTMREAEHQLKRLHTEMNETITIAREEAEKLKGKAKVELDAAVVVTKDAKEKVREILSAVHEGRAEDRELQKAVKDARKAIDHLKTYLKTRSV